MATQIYLGNPPPKIKEQIINNYKPEIDMTKVPLHFVAEEPNATMSFRINNGTFETSPTGEEGSWTPYESDTSITLVNVGDKVYFRAGSDEGNENCQHNSFNIPSKVSVNGNIQSLLDRKMMRPDAPDSCYQSLFLNCNITSIPKLPAITVYNNSYIYIFSNCLLLQDITIELPATNVNKYTYSQMFMDCKIQKMTFLDKTSSEVKDFIEGGILGSYIYHQMEVKCTDKTILVSAQFNDSVGYWEWLISDK